MIKHLPLKMACHLREWQYYANKTTYHLYSGLFALFFMLYSTTGYTKTHNCAQEALEEHRIQQHETDPVLWDRYKRAYKAASVSFRSPTSTSIPLQAYVIANTHGYGAINNCELQQALEQVNTHFEGSGFSFFFTGVHPINSDKYFSIKDFDEGDSLYVTLNNPNAINIYFVDYSAGYCGWANFPWSNKKYILLSNKCAINSSTFAHELGHYLGLLHTHSTSNGEELVDGSNCSSTGDLLCDTPADPNLSGNVGSDCIYTGTDTDANNAIYNPDTENLMSYSPKDCRTQFSTDQINRMDFYYTSIRASQLTSTNLVNLGCPCVNDSDQDGICDESDACPNFPDVDSDNNGVADACDACTIINFEDYIFYEFSGQDEGDEDVLDNGATVRIEENGWKAIALDYTITPNTVLEFDFASYIPGEHHSIAFDDELVFPPANQIKLYGTESTLDMMNGAYTYTANGAYQHFSIPIGTAMTGYYDYIILITDQDASPQDANSYFRNLKIYEDTDSDLACDLTATLPVELSWFAGRPNDCSNLLEWKSEVEENFDYYELEWSEDGRVFNSKAVLKGTGGGYPSYYAYTDHSIGIQNYYRLKMVDLDATFEYSALIYIENNCQNNPNTYFYPNPLHQYAEKLHIELLSSKKEEQFLLINQFGVILRSFRVSTDGLETIHTIDLADYSAGVYFIQQVGTAQTQKLILLD